jgi:hypothetical protein
MNRSAQYKITRYPVRRVIVKRSASGLKWRGAAKISCDGPLSKPWNILNPMGARVG